MPLNSKNADMIRVKHMADAAREALSFIKGKTHEDFADNRQLILSLIKEIEIIGEAAGKVSRSFRDKQIEIPWETIIGTRNRLIHGYFDVNLDIVWSTVTKELPALLAQLEDTIHKMEK